MATRRSLSKTISASEKICQRLRDLVPAHLLEFSQLLYTWLIPHCDDWGRFAGDVFTVRMNVMPASKRKDEDFRLALDGLARSGALSIHDGNGQRYLQIANWDLFQEGLHRRTKSRFGELTPAAGAGALSCSEAELQELFVAALRARGEWSGRRIMKITQQLRVGNSYLDLVALLEDQAQVLFELKRQLATKSVIRQITKYRGLLAAETGKVECVVLAAGLAAGLTIARFEEQRVRLIVYGDDLALSEHTSSGVIPCEMTRIDVTACDLQKGREGKGREVNLKTDSVRARARTTWADATDPAAPGLDSLRWNTNGLFECILEHAHGADFDWRIELRKVSRPLCRRYEPRQVLGALLHMTAEKKKPRDLAEFRKWLFADLKHGYYEKKGFYERAVRRLRTFRER